MHLGAERRDHRIGVGDDRTFCIAYPMLAACQSAFIVERASSGTIMK